MADALEEHFVVRVLDDDLAALLRAVLETEEAEMSASGWTLTFEHERVGCLTIVKDGVAASYPATVHMLPTIVETYKSHNHVNLVKAADVGQVIVVHPVPEDQAAADLINNLIAQADADELPLESPDGVTLPMQAVRDRVFRKDFKVSPKTIQTVEQQLVTLMNGEAPTGWVFEDVQETFVVDEDTGRGEWVPSSRIAASNIKK